MDDEFQMRRLRRRLNWPRLTFWGVSLTPSFRKGFRRSLVVFNPFQGFFRAHRGYPLGFDASERTLLHAVDHPCACQKIIRKLFIVCERTRTNVLRTDHASRLSNLNPKNPKQSKAVAHVFFSPSAQQVPTQNLSRTSTNAGERPCHHLDDSTKSAFTTAIRQQNRRLSVTNGR